MSAPVLDAGRYELGPVLGHGGMALVYLAHDRADDRTVAVKVLADNLAADPELRRRFGREAQLAERLSHPNILQVLDSGEDAGRAYIVFEYVDGRNLAEELRREGRLPSARAAELGAQAAAALAHAHDHGLVHRDVKPQNLLLTADGTVKVSDFGIARVVDGTRLTEVGTVLGTAAYLAPEQAAGEEATAAADVYGLGAVLYELLTGRPPYDASTLTELVHRRAQGPPKAPSAVCDGVAGDLEGVVLACLCEDPNRRPTARDVELMLRGELEAPTRVLNAAAAKPTAIRRRNGPRRRWLALGSTVAAAAVAAGAVGIALGGGSASPKPAPTAPRIAAVPPAPTAAGAARNLARWLRRQAH